MCILCHGMGADFDAYFDVLALIFGAYFSE
jgi:hypothetical protein